MKKLVLALPIVLLTACDKPTSDVQLYCNHIDTPTFIHAKTYSDEVKLDINGIKVTLGKTKDTVLFDTVYQNFKGKMPGTEDIVEFDLSIDIERDTINSYTVSFGNLKYGCNILIPVKHNYPKLTETEKCVQYITKNVFYSQNCATSDFCGLSIIVRKYKHFKDGSTIYHNEFKNIPATDAIKISKNWDYLNPKFYKNGKEEHEKDACETVERLKQYMADKNLSEKLIHIYEEDAKE
jgi:hypothetical protein